MKKILTFTLSLLLVSILSWAKTDFDPQTLTLQADGTYVVDTSEIGADIEGYNGATPLLVYIKNDKVLNIEFLPNDETPNYFGRLKQKLGSLWSGKSVKEAAEVEPDGRTGATYSADAVVANVRLAVEYYQQHKRNIGKGKRTNR